MSNETSTITNTPAVRGENTAGGDGITGVSNEVGGTGIHGISDKGFGLLGESQSGRGVVARSKADYGLRAASEKSAGIRGSSVEGRGVEGWAINNEGVVGISKNDNGVWGQTEGAGIGVLGTSTSGVGVYGKGGRLAGLFEGDVEITGKISAPKSTMTCFEVSLSNADCAEDFIIGADLSVEPGTVMVLGEEGALFPSLHAYDKRVVGVISGAGEYKPGIVLDRQESGGNRQPVALLGKVFCKVDAQYGAIEVGDLLTTSPKLGHAMKAEDPFKSFGAVLGKALRPLREGQSLIPILIALQ